MRSKELELGRKQGELSDCERDYQTVGEQLRVEGDGPRQNQLKDQLQLLRQRMDQLETEIGQLQQEIQQKATHLNTLTNILQSHSDQFNEMLTAYQWVLTNWRCAVNLNPKTPQEIITELMRIPKGRSQYTALEQFVAAVVHRFENVALLAPLQAWGEQHINEWAGLFDWLADLQKHHNQQAQPALLIAISRSDEASTQSQSGDRYQFKAWVIQDIDHYKKHRQGYNPLYGSAETGEETYSLDELLEKAPQFLSQFLAECSSAYANEPEIHVFLSLDLMDQAVDRWQLNEGYGRPERIGHRYKVVIRCIERLGRSYRQRPRWIRKWERHQALLQETAHPFFMACDDNDLDALFDRLEELEDAAADVEAEETPVIGLKMTQAPCQVGGYSVFGALLQFGYPLAIWGRCDLSGTPNETQLDRVLQKADLEKLPDEVKRERRGCRKQPEDCHIGHHLALIWDDPDLIPPKSA